MTSLCSFCPINRWHTVNSSLEEGPLVVEDDFGERYPNVGDGLIRRRLVRWLWWAPIRVAITAVQCVVATVSLKNFLCNSTLKDSSIGGKLKVTAIDVARVVAAPITLLGLEFAALYGLVRPKDGRKLLSTIASLGLGIPRLSQEEYIKSFTTLRQLNGCRSIENLRERGLVVKVCPPLSSLLLGKHVQSFGTLYVVSSPSRKKNKGEDLPWSSEEAEQIFLGHFAMRRMSTRV